MGKKYQIDFANGCANFNYITPNGNKKTSRFMIFTDFMGLKIFTPLGVEYLTEENSEVI